MTIICPNCGHEINIDVNSFRKVMHDHPGFVDVVFEEILKNTEWFYRAADMFEEEMKERRKSERAQRKQEQELLDKEIDEMSPDDHVDYLNKPHKELPNKFKHHRTVYRQPHKHVPMNQPNIGKQRVSCSARLYKERMNTKYTRAQWAEVLNTYGKKFGIKFSENRITSYENHGVSPKMDRMTVYAKATGMPISYLCGYGPDDVVPKNEILGAMYKKNKRVWRNSKDAA